MEVGVPWVITWRFEVPVPAACSLGPVVVQFVGDVELGTYPSMLDAAMEVSALRPQSVIICLDGLRFRSHDAIAVFLTIWARVVRRLSVPLVLVVGSAEQRHRLRTLPLAGLVPIEHDLTSALYRAGCSPPPPASPPSLMV